MYRIRIESNDEVVYDCSTDHLIVSTDNHVMSSGFMNPIDIQDDIAEIMIMVSEKMYGRLDDKKDDKDINTIAIGATLIAMNNAVNILQSASRCDDDAFDIMSDKVLEFANSLAECMIESVPNSINSFMFASMDQINQMISDAVMEELAKFEENETGESDE